MQYPTEVPGVTLVDAMAEALRSRGRDTADLEAVLRDEAERISFEERFLHRPLNVDLSGGEKKRNETLQLAVLQPKIAILDELDSGLDIDALRDCARRVEAMSNDGSRRARDHALQPPARRAAAGPRAHPVEGPDRGERRPRARRRARQLAATPPTSTRTRTTTPSPRPAASTTSSPDRRTQLRPVCFRRPVASSEADRTGCWWLSSAVMAADAGSQWEERDGGLHRVFEFADFSEAFAFMTRVALLAEKADHHPDWSNSWNRVDITLSSHSAGNVVTDADRELAARIDRIVA